MTDNNIVNFNKLQAKHLANKNIDTVMITRLQILEQLEEKLNLLEYSIEELKPKVSKLFSMSNREYYQDTSHWASWGDRSSNDNGKSYYNKKDSENMVRDNLYNFNYDLIKQCKNILIQPEKDITRDLLGLFADNILKLYNMDYNLNNPTVDKVKESEIQPRVREIAITSNQGTIACKGFSLNGVLQDVHNTRSELYLSELIETPLKQVKDGKLMLLYLSVELKELQRTINFDLTRTQFVAILLYLINEYNLITNGE